MATSGESHHICPDGSDLKWKQVGVNEVRNPRELTFLFQLLTADHPSQDRKAVATIEKIMFANNDYLPDSWFKAKIHGELDVADIEFVDPPPNDGEYGVLEVYFTKPSGVVISD